VRILHTVEFYRPSVGGAQEVVKQISEELVRRGHEVTVATSNLPTRASGNVAGVRIEGFSISGNATSGFAGETARYTQFLIDGNFDVMMNYAAQQWATDLAFSVLDKVPYPKVLAPCGFSALHDRSYADYFRAMPDVLRRYDRLVFHSNDYRDAAFARRHGVTNSVTIPNGASATEFDQPRSEFRRRHGIPADRPMLLTVGSHTGAKGHDAAIAAFREAKIGPATLVVIGDERENAGCFRKCSRASRHASLFSLGRKRVVLLAPPRAETVAAFQAADLFLFPSNLECSPIVLFEAAASRTPFVASSAGNASEIARWTGAGLVVPTSRKNDGTVAVAVPAMARAIERLIHDSVERRRLADAGYAAWKRSFTWEAIATQYERVYEAACA
jgi:glycosyltransferase involved in cell wall biosynthesis